MSISEEIEQKIKKIEQEPDSRLRTVRLHGLRVLLARLTSSSS